MALLAEDDLDQAARDELDTYNRRLGLEDIPKPWYRKAAELGVAVAIPLAILSLMAYGDKIAAYIEASK